MKNRLRIISFVFLALSALALAQNTTRGRDFYICFLPNYHDSGSGANLDSLYIYIVAEVPTSGTISMRNRAGQTTTINYTIADPTQIFRRSLSWSSYELFGYNQRGTLNATNDNETVAKASVHITADHNVAVYALNKADKSSDATLVLPTTCLGTDYRVLSYKSDGTSSVSRNPVEYTPSEFCVVASEDNTTVNIKPSAPTTKSGLAIKNITLQKGDVYLVQAEFSTRVLNYDLSGTVVSSSKPVGVFAGHQRATLPVEVSTLLSRDCLYEQLLPHSVWGTKYVLTPLAQPVGQTPLGTDVYRVVAAEDSTVLRFNGIVLTTLAANGVYEGPLTQAGLLSSSRKVMVALYKKTANTSNNTQDGDPFMMVIPPRRQYSTNYRFTNVQVSGVYKQQFITLIASQKDIPAVRIDGKAVTAAFSSVPNSCYSYISLPMTDGVHTLSSPSPVGLYVYGFGPADSYGYVGGMDFIPDVEDQQLDAGPNRSMCSGTTTTLVAKHAASDVRWTPSTGLSCDTCISTLAQPTKTTRYIVTGVDSAGCISSDTVTLTIRDLPVNYTLGPSTTNGAINLPVGTVFPLDVNGESQYWDSVVTTKLVATITYDSDCMVFADSVRIGTGLSSEWKVTYVDSLSSTQRGVAVFVAEGDTVIRADGQLIVPYFKSMLGREFAINAGLSVVSYGKTVNCARSQTRGAAITLSTCVANLRHVELSTTPFALYDIVPNPVRTNNLAVEYSVGFGADVDISVYDLHGECVEKLTQQWHERGSYRHKWTTSSLSAGVYLVVMQAAGLLEKKTLVIDR